MARKIEVEIVGDTRQLERSFNKASRSTASFANNLESPFARAGVKSGNAFATAFSKSGRSAFIGGFAGTGAALIGEQVLAEVSKSIDIASNLQEQISKSRQVFGDASKDVEDWASETAASFGIAQDAALEATGTFGNLFATVQIDAGKAAELSVTLTRLAADLASFNNADPSDVLLAIRSGLVGEAEPLRKFGVLLSEARVQQEALAATGKTSVTQLTNQEKALARVAIILNDTKKAQGDFQRTSDGLANQQRILAAEVRNLEADLGSLLIPAMTTLVGVLGDATAGAAALVDGLKLIGDVEIPTITIPFVTKLGGGTVGGAVAKGFKTTAKTPLNPLFGLVAIGETAKQIKKQFEDVPEIDVTKEAKAFTDNVGSFLDGLDKGVKATAKKVAAFGQKGFKPLEDNDLGKKSQESFDNLIASLDLKFDRAGLFGSTGAQLSVLKETENAIRARIKEHGKTTSLLRDLFRVQQQRQGVFDQIAATAEDAAAAQKQRLADVAEARREAAEKAAEVLQATQFKALGLNATGDKVTPGVANLKKQLGSLTDRLIDADKLSNPIKGQLARIGDVLSGEFGKVTEDSRLKIVELFRTIRDTFDKEGKKAEGPLTKTTSLNSSKILSGLGLDESTLKELQGRLSRFNSAGVSLSATGVGAFGVPINTGTQGVVPEVNVFVGGREVESEVTTQQRKKTARGMTSGRGAFAGRRSGI